MSMFQYTHEMILNSLLAEDGTEKARAFVIPANGSVSSNYLKFAEDFDSKTDEKGFTLQRFGEYKTRNVYGQKVFKTSGIRGKKSVMTIECNGLIAKDEAGVYEAGLYNFTFAIKMMNRFYGEYAHPDYQGFFKPIMIGFEVSPELAADGEKLASVLANDLKMVIPENNKFALVRTDGSKVIITLPDVYAHFGEYRFERYDPTMCDSCLGEYFARNIEDKITVEDGTEPFATGEYLIENYRFPSYPNIRYAALNEDEYPVAGALYTEYVFTYHVHRLGYGGADTVGQEVHASTKHVLFVKNDLVEDFEKVLTEAGLEIVDLSKKDVTPTPTPTPDTETTKAVVIINAPSLSRSQKENGYQFTADESPVLENANFVWSVVSGPATINASTGVLALDDAAEVGDEIVVKASLEGYEPATLTVKVIA